MNQSDSSDPISFALDATNLSATQHNATQRNNAETDAGHGSVDWTEGANAQKAAAALLIVPALRTALVSGFAESIGSNTADVAADASAQLERILFATGGGLAVCVARALVQLMAACDARAMSRVKAEVAAGEEEEEKGGGGGRGEGGEEEDDPDGFPAFFPRTVRSASLFSTFLALFEAGE